MRHYNIFNVICDYDRNRYTAFPDMQKSYSTHSIFGAKKKKMVFSRLSSIEGYFDDSNLQTR